MAKRKAYSYIRMSSGQQLKGDSLRRQLNLSRDYAEKNELELDESLKDLGISAYEGDNVKNGALGKFIELIKSNSIDKNSYLLIESLDRLSRDKISNALNIFLEIIQSGITIVTLSDQQLYNKNTIDNDLSKILLSLLILSRAHEESLIKSMRLSKSWELKKTNARLHKTPITKQTPSWIKLIDNKYYIDDEAAETVKIIYQYCIDGIGDYKIAKILNEQKIKPIGRSAHWNRSYIRQILTNQSTFGRFQPKKVQINTKKFISDGVFIDDYYPKVIDEATWKLANSARKKRENTAKGRKGKFFSNVFQGITKCSKCNGTMQFVNKGRKPKGGKYLVCSKSTIGICEHKKLYNYDKLESVITRGIIKGIKPTSNNEDIISLLSKKKSALLTSKQLLLEKIDTLYKSYLKTKSNLKLDFIEKFDTELNKINEDLDIVELEINDYKQTTESSAVLAIDKYTNSDDNTKTYQQRAQLSKNIKLVIKEISFSDSLITITTRNNYYYAIVDNEMISFDICKAMKNKYLLFDEIDMHSL